jgi:hypothetical protein
MFLSKATFEHSKYNILANFSLSLQKKSLRASWGDLTVGATATRQICVINNGTVPSTLSMSAGDWVH